MKFKIMVLFISFPFEVLAQNYCSEPRTPYCVEGFDTYTDEFSFNSCRSDLDSYERDVERYLQCLEDWVEETAAEARTAADRAVDDYNEAIEHFNCKARDPDRFC